MACVRRTPISPERIRQLDGTADAGIGRRPCAAPQARQLCASAPACCLCLMKTVGGGKGVKGGMRHAARTLHRGAGRAGAVVDLVGQDAGRGRCVSIFLDKNRRYIGKSQSERPPERTQRPPHQTAQASSMCGEPSRRCSSSLAMGSSWGAVASTTKRIAENVCHHAVITHGVILSTATKGGGLGRGATDGA
eukprot:SAG25_NODE_1630_length_2648_cov_6.231463_1_plen_192_part_00